VWTKRECRKRACGQVGDNSRRALCRNRSPGKRVAPNLPTLIHPLPTLRRAGPAANRKRLRRNNNKFFDLKGQKITSPTHTKRNRGLSFGVITRRIHCQLVGTRVVVLYSRHDDQCSPAACMSSSICEVRVKNKANRHAMGCPIPEDLPPCDDAAVQGDRKE